jgi:hypothetical protein
LGSPSDTRLRLQVGAADCGEYRQACYVRREEQKSALGQIQNAENKKSRS